MGDLREALDHNQLELHYQPKLNLATGLIDGAEGLVRWQHPRLGSVPPDSFIALAEETGNIRRLTRWALGTGIAQAQAWNSTAARCAYRSMFPRATSTTRSCRNGSPNCSRCTRCSRQHPARGHRKRGDGQARRGDPRAAQLADQGIDLAIDDFGVGQSSFAYLRQLPVSELKIDKVFTQRITDALGRPHDRALDHRARPSPGYTGHRRGVDNDEALRFLRQAGCDYAQGYLIARALPADAFERMIDSRNGSASRSDAAHEAQAGHCRVAVRRLHRRRTGFPRRRVSSRRACRGDGEDRSWTEGGLARCASATATIRCRSPARLSLSWQMTDSLLAVARPAGAGQTSPELGVLSRLPALAAGVDVALAVVAARGRLLPAGVAGKRWRRLDQPLDADASALNSWIGEETAHDRRGSAARTSRHLRQLRVGVARSAGTILPAN
jgi:EAL domain-containing protein (putative c-di-GMP-specific phosphodiesterase class I)